MDKKDRSVIIPDLPDHPNMGTVVTRFPPEPSGYLHLGHIKALLHNYLYAKKYEGKIILRFDDTNPEKEKEIYKESIKEDIKRLGLICDTLTYTSDYFHLIDNCAYQLIKKNLAYMDFSTDDEISKQRSELRPSPYRDSDVDTNLKEFTLLLSMNSDNSANSNSKRGCLRAKIDYRNTNGCLRDPVLYRFKSIKHPRDLNRSCFPTYDFSCPLVDRFQGVTHSMRSIEYQGRDAQYKWFLKHIAFPVDPSNSTSTTSTKSSTTSTSSTSYLSSASSTYSESLEPSEPSELSENTQKDIGKKDPLPMSYGRLNFLYTVLSKRKLGRLVESGLVSGWDDPRMPTFRGIIRAGMQIEPLIAYITTQMLSKIPVTLEWSKIWCYNSTYLNTKARRLYGIGPNIIEVILQGTSGIPTSVNIPNHPTIPEMGYHTLAVSNVLYVDAEDFPNLTDPTEPLLNQRYTLVNLGNVKVTKTNPLTLTYDPDDKDYRRTMKITWLPKQGSQECQKVITKIIAKKYGYLLTVPKLEDNDDIVDKFNPKSETISEILIENAILDVTPGTTFQIMRKGYFYLDSNENGKIIIHGPTP